MAPPLPATYKAAVIEKTGEPLTVKQLPLRQPQEHEVLLKVLACGVCGSDLSIAAGHMDPNVAPRIPGHEMVGDVAAVGAGVTRFQPGDRVGGAWHGGHDGTCRACARGQFQMCDHAAVVGVTYDGGYAEYAVLREEAVVHVPRDMDPAAVAPLLCAGVTVFNGIRRMHVEQGNLVAVQGVGGLGHMAIQYASKMGYRVVALSRGEDKREFALRLGAHDYIDTGREDAAEALAKLGGAALICATAPNPKAMGPLVKGLQAGGKLLALAAVGSVEFDIASLILRGASVHGWPSGHPLDCEEAIQFAQDHGVEAIVQKFSLDDVNKALGTVEDGSVRFRGVLCIG